MAEEYEVLAQFSRASVKRLEGGAPICFISSRSRGKLDRRYVGLRVTTGELVAKRAPQPDEKSEPLLDLKEVKQIALLQFDSLPYDLRDLSCDLPNLGMYPNRLLIRFRGTFVPNWLLLLDSENMDHWLKGLLAYRQYLDELPNEGLIKMYLWREYYEFACVGSTYSQFYSEENLQPEELDPAWNLCVSEKELREWLSSNMNAVFKPSRLSELLLKYLPTHKRSSGSFDIFAKLLQLCLWSSQKALEEVFGQFFPKVVHFSSRVHSSEIEQFLWKCQAESPADLVRLKCSSDVPFNEDTTQFASFLDMLFCKANIVTDTSRTESVYQNMSLPLSAYYISTSHNTYLTGDQLRSESNMQCYVSALLQGCRCIELDLWDGPRDTAVIYHGHTMTTKIDLEPVLQTIRENAFTRSYAPLILSLEDHCSLLQQARTADLLIQIFGTTLLTAPVEPDARELPSPEQLRYRVLVKHSKQKSRFAISPPSPDGNGSDASIHTGNVLVKNPITATWEPYVAVLTATDLLFMSDDSPDRRESQPSVNYMEELLDCVWFHEDASRQEAESRIRQHCVYEDGRFLVRPSSKPGDFTLSFINGGVIQHCSIRSTPDPDSPTRRQFSIPYIKSPAGADETQNYFPKMADLIAYCQDFGIDQAKYFLTHPLPQEMKNFPWFIGTISKQDAEEYLKQVPYSGAFLVRKKEGDLLDGEFVLSFRAEREIKRCIISCNRGTAMMGNFSHFDSLPQLVRHFSEHPIYRNICLRYPVNAETVERVLKTGFQSINCRVICQSDYCGIIKQGEDFDEFIGEDMSMRATVDYVSKAVDELTFRRGDVLVDVCQTSPDWWTGTLESSGTRGLAPAAALEPCNSGEYVEMSISLPHICRVMVPHSDLSDRSYYLSIEFRSDDPCGMTSITASRPTAENTSLVMKVPTEDQLCEWLRQLGARRQRYIKPISVAQDMRKEKIAQQLSDLVVYCVPTRNPEQKTHFKPSQFYEMISMPETRMPKNLNCQLAHDIRDFASNQLVRVYPKTSRLNSSNFNPLIPWSLGCQMVALNWQTGDRAMLLNRALFSDNGGCGYVLRPSNSSTEASSKVSVQLRVLAGRRLPRLSPRLTCSFVEAELNGCISRSATVDENGLNPVYQDCALSVTACQTDSILRIAVMETDAWQDPVVIGQFAGPIRILRGGFRSVPLFNEFGDEVPMATLLVHLDYH